MSMPTIRIDRRGVTVTVRRDGVELRTIICRSLQAAVALEAKLSGDATFTSWWVTVNEDPRPSAAHPYERPFADSPTPAARRSQSRRQISVTADDTLLTITDGERTRRKSCSTAKVARNLATRYRNSPELAERWLYADARAP